MPQIFDAFVIFASMMQRYENFSKLPNFLAIIFHKNAKVTQLLSYSFRTITFLVYPRN